MQGEWGALVRTERTCEALRHEGTMNTHGAERDQRAWVAETGTQKDELGEEERV